MSDFEGDFQRLAKQTQGELNKFADRFIDACKGETDRGLALVIAAGLDEALARLMQASWPRANQGRVKKMFDAENVLGPFSARIKVSYATGLIGPGVRSQLDIIRDVRNKFAHDLTGIDAPLSFRSDPIRGSCMSLNVPEHFSKMMSQMVEYAPLQTRPQIEAISAWLGDTSGFSPRKRFHISGMLLSMFLTMRSNPGAFTMLKVYASFVEEAGGAAPQLDY